MYKIYLTKKNSEWKVLQNPIKGNNYSDIMYFPTESDKDDFLNKFLALKDKSWRDEVSEVGAPHTLVWKDETHFTVTLNLTKDLGHGGEKGTVSRKDATSSDFIIMEDDNEKETSKNRFTFWNVNCQFSGTNNYSNVTFSAEKDIFFTYGIQNMFKELNGNPALIRLSRKTTNQPVAYGTETSYQEDFNFEDGVFVEKEVIPLIDGDLPERFNNYILYTIQSAVSGRTRLKDPNSGSELPFLGATSTQLYYSVKIGKGGESTKGDATHLTIYFNSGGGGIAPFPDLTHILYKPNYLASGYRDFSRLLQGSEYVLSSQVMPFNEVTLPEERGAATLSVPPNNEGEDDILETKIPINGTMKPFMPYTNLNFTFAKKLSDLFKNTPRNLKIFASQFNKFVLTYGNINFEIKLEFTDKNDYDENEYFYSIYNAGQSLLIDLHFPGPAYYYENPNGLRGIRFDDNYALPRVASGDQGVFQNTNQINLTNNINQRNKKLSLASSGVSIAAGIAENASRPVVGYAMASPEYRWLVSGAEGVGASGNIANNLTSNISKILSAKDAIHQQAAQMADAFNNTGQFNDGSSAGIRIITDHSEGFRSQATWAVIHYELAEPLKTMVKNFLYMYGVAAGDNLYDVIATMNETAENNQKFSYLQATDLSNVYQAMQEGISPQEAVIASNSLANGIRCGVYKTENNPFSFIGDYELPQEGKDA